MEFDELLAQVIALLQRQGRVSAVRDSEGGLPPDHCPHPFNIDQ
jgi:hypothetical protein